MKRASMRQYQMVLLVAVLGAMLTGCADKLTLDNFDRVQIKHSDKADVTFFIGSPDNIVYDRWIYSRPNKHLDVTVFFTETGSVYRKMWIDPVNWIDTQEEGSGIRQKESNRSISIEHTKRTN